MIILDTNVITEILRTAPNESVTSWLKSCTDDIAITAITVAELLAGVELLSSGKRRKALSARINAVLSMYRGTQRKHKYFGTL